MDIGSMIVGASLFVTGWSVGVTTYGKKVSAHKPPKAICGCTHELSFHDPKAGECHAQEYIPATGSHYSYYERCTCRRYTGPEPLTEYYAPEITE